MKKSYILLLSLLLLIACDSAKGIIDPGISSPQQMIIPTDGTMSITVDVFAKAVQKTVYDDLSTGPLLFMVYQGSTFADYLNQQNISPEQFLQSKSLETYMKAHLIPSAIDRSKLLDNPGLSVNYHNALGEKVTMTILDNGHATITGGGIIKLNRCYQAAHEQHDVYPDSSYVCVMAKPLDFR